jgi:hypothetical protein
MAFTDGRRLLVTDAGNGAVHVIDVVHGTHVGYVAPPGSIAGPRGVATKASLAAISTGQWVEHDDHSVRVYSVRVYERSSGGGESAWTAVRVIRSDQLHTPYGLRFTADGLRLAVADCFRQCVTFF